MRNLLKYLFITVSLFFSINSFSQLLKNWWLIGGNASFSYSSGKEYTSTMKITDFQISPMAGYFFIDKFAAGLRPSYMIVIYRNSYGGKWGTRDFILAPFLRYYFLPVEKNVNLLTDVSYGLEWGKYKLYGQQPDIKYDNKIFSIMAGPAIFLNKHTSLEITLGYIHSTRGPVDTFPTNTLRLGIGLQIHLGKKEINW